MYVSRLLATLVGEPARTVVRTPTNTVTAAEFRQSIVDSAAALHRAGVAATTVVAILTEPNVPAMLTTRYAGHLLGAAVTHIRSANARHDGESLPITVQADILRDTGSHVLVVDAANADRGRALAAALPGLTVLGPDELTASGELPPFAPYVPDNLAVIDLTSGSTGRPKLVRQSFATRAARIDLSAADSAAAYPRTLLSVTPISHATATLIDSALVGGGAVVLHPDFDVDAVLYALAEHEVTDVYLAVPHLYQLIDHPGIDHARRPALRQVVYSGTAAAPSRVARAVEVFGTALTQLYGSTEAGGITTLDPADHAEPELRGTVGRPFSWVRLEIRRPGADLSVDRGEIGEICVRSDTLMAGYLGRPDDSQAVLRGGWLRTGDLGQWDRYGRLRLVGRMSDVVKTGGLKLYPAAIERALLTHPSVANAAVYSIRDADYAEHVHAAVQPRGAVTVDDLARHVATALSLAHVPSKITLWDAIPLTPSGKPDHRYLRGTP